MTVHESHPAPAAATANRSVRDATFDILKGIGILEVMLHHLLSFSARKYAVPGAPDWWTLTIANRIFHFAVPTFLLASALLLARSVAAKPKPGWKRFFARRAQRSLWPYVLWTCFYLLFRIYVIRVGSDTMTTTLSLPFVGSLTAPALLVDGREWFFNLFWGRAYFHLYFMVVLLQFSVAFPLLYCGLRRLRIGFGGVLLASALLQGGVYWIQATSLRLPFPASMVLWYVPSILIGVWLGLNWSQWEAVWKGWRLPIGAAMTAGFAVYVTLAIIRLGGGRITSLPFNAGMAVYSTGIALLLLAAARRLAAETRVGAFLARVGDRSLALYLLHPMILYLMSGPTITAFLSALPLSPLFAGLLLFAVTWGLTSLTRRLRLEGFLFGR